MEQTSTATTAARLSGEGVQMVVGLLQGDHRRGAPGVSHVNALNVALQAKLADEHGIQAWAQPAGAGGRDEEIDLLRLPARLLQRGEQGPPAKVDAGLAETALQVVQRFGRGEPGAIDGQIPPLDPAVEEEAAAPVVGVAGQSQDLLLAETVHRVGRAHGDDTREIHRSPFPLPNNRSTGNFPYPLEV